MILISYNSKASHMFSQECVGGPKNGSSKLARRATRWNESFHLSWKIGSFDYNQGCTYLAFAGVNSKSAWRAAVGGPRNGSSKPTQRATRWIESFHLSRTRGSLDYKQGCTDYAFTGVNSKLAWRAARLQSSCTGVHSRTRHWSAMALTMYYANQRSDGNQWWSQLWKHLDHRSVLEVPVRSSSFPIFWE